MKKMFLSCCSVFICCLMQAQNPKYRVLSIPAQHNNKLFREPWMGGMDSPEFSEIDLNGDGIKDLFVFDKVGSKVLTFLSDGSGTDTMYKYAPQYEALFPKDLSFWALLIDYNHDGIPDIFSHSSYNNYSGIKVYKGSMLNGNLHYDLVCPLIKYTDQTITPTVYSNTNDIPAITDVNGDGDIDILSYGNFGSTIAYFENQAVENPGNPAFSLDSFQYSLVTTCWGNITQSLTSNSILLNQSCKGGSTAGQPQPAEQRHAGNSLFPLTDPVYHTTDLLNGNLGYNNLLLLKNCGNATYANVCEWDSIYPTCNVPMFMATYPAAFGVDVNHDGLEDILISPNIPGSNFVGGGAGRNIKNVMYYKNTGDTACMYEYQSDSFLIQHSLDFGSNSKALFYDFNGDGLTDIIVGNLGYFDFLPTYTSTLAYYENTGTATHPAFTEVTTDVNNISQYNLVSVDPTFGDLDGDGKNDMVIGDSYGYLYYFKNTAATGSSFPSITSAQYQGINVGIDAAPFLYDVNGDSLLDLVVGNQTGKLTYFWNFGTKTNPQFSQGSSNSFFGRINVTSGGNAGYSQPYITKDSANNLLLFVGAANGNIYEYLIDKNNLLSGSFNLIDSNFIGQSVGSMSTISIADINNDGRLEYLLGNSRGGLMMFSDSMWDSGTILGTNDLVFHNNDISIYPNPARQYFVCLPQNTTFINPQTEIYNILGEKMNPAINFAGNKITVGTTGLSNGFYIVRITDAGKVFTAKIMIQQ